MQLRATWCTNLISSHFTGATSGRRSMNNTSQRSWCSIWQCLAVSGRCSASASCLCFTFCFLMFFSHSSSEQLQNVRKLVVLSWALSIFIFNTRSWVVQELQDIARSAHEGQSPDTTLFDPKACWFSWRISVAFELQFATCVERICFQWWTPVQVKHMEKEWKGWMLWQFQGFLSLYHWQLPSTPWAGAPTPKSPAKHGATLSSGQSFLLMVMPLQLCRIILIMIWQVLPKAVFKSDFCFSEMEISGCCCCWSNETVSNGRPGPIS